MIGTMKYKANNAKNITSEDKEDARVALAKYETITNKTDRERFIKAFEMSLNNPKGSKGGGDFKFANAFEKGLLHEDKTEIGSEDNMLTRI